MRVPSLRPGRGSGVRGAMPWSRQDLTEPFSSLHEEIDELFEEFARSPALLGGRRGRSGFPALDLVERDGVLHLTAELPGLKEEDVEVTVNGDTLHISGEKKAEHEEKDDAHHIVERAFGRFERMVSLGFEPDPDTVEADFDRGLLTVKIPRPADAKPNGKRVRIGRKR